MIVDTQTLRELEIFRARDGGASVFATIDRTLTRRGRGTVERLLLEPPGEASELGKRQAAISFLHDREYSFRITEDQIRPIDSYLDSSYTTLSATTVLGRFIEASWIALRYPRLLREVTSGIHALRRLVARASRAIEPLAGDDAPSELARIRDGIRSVLDRIHGQGQGVQRADSYGSVLEIDRVLRGPLGDDLRSLLTLLGELDALAAVARLLEEGYVLTRIVDDGTSQLEGDALWHPFLPDAVGNPVSLAGGETLVFLTGPNMAGKTTYLRTLGVCLYLSQRGLPVPARRFQCSPVDRLITGLAPEDSLRRGMSFFLAEVRRVKEVVEAVARGERTVAIFDEVFRGTNVADALEATRTVLLGCSRARSSMFVFASHLVELAQDLAPLDSVRFCYFDGDLDESRLRFDYRLRRGITDQRFGMTLVRREGLPELLASIPIDPTPS